MILILGFGQVFFSQEKEGLDLGNISGNTQIIAQYYNEDTLINDVRIMLDEYNYETNVKVAIERIQELSDKLEKKAYKMTLLKENEDG